MQDQITGRRAWAVSPATGGYCGQPRVNDEGETEEGYAQ